MVVTFVSIYNLFFISVLFLIGVQYWPLKHQPFTHAKLMYNWFFDYRKGGEGPSGADPVLKLTQNTFAPSKW